jgi:hypothetical protein
MEDGIQQPTTFSNVAHKFVFKKCTNSLFFVLASLDQSYRTQVLCYPKDKLCVSDQQEDNFIRKSKVSTGFDIKESNTSSDLGMFEIFCSDGVELNPKTKPFV